jgi:addiction module HigA family antidote
MPRLLPSVTPGELLREEFLKPMGISQYRLAKEIGVPAQRIGEIVAGRRAITADTDLRLARFFGLSHGYWLRAQAAHDSEVAQRALAATLAKIRPWVATRPRGARAPQGQMRRRSALGAARISRARAARRGE